MTGTSDDEEFRKVSKEWRPPPWCETDDDIVASAAQFGRDYERKRCENAAVPPGWRLVPEEPTPDMLLAAIEHSNRRAKKLIPMQPLKATDWAEAAIGRYRAMLAAAPQGVMHFLGNSFVPILTSPGSDEYSTREDFGRIEAVTEHRPNWVWWRGCMSAFAKPKPTWWRLFR
jgi:hypothetical protein